MLYFSKIQDDPYRIIAPISCIMANFHKLNQTNIVGCVCYKAPPYCNRLTAVTADTILY